MRFEFPSGHKFPSWMFNARGWTSEVWRVSKLCAPRRAAHDESLQDGTPQQPPHKVQAEITRRPSLCGTLLCNCWVSSRRLSTLEAQHVERAEACVHNGNTAAKPYPRSVSVLCFSKPSSRMVRGGGNQGFYEKFPPVGSCLGLLKRISQVACSYVQM